MGTHYGRGLSSREYVFAVFRRTCILKIVAIVKYSTKLWVLSYEDKSVYFGVVLVVLLLVYT